MILVTPADVGPLAYARLLRDGAAVVLGPGVSRPADIPDSPGLRALVAADIPAGTVLTGLAALWVHGWIEAAPARWHVAGPRGMRNRTHPRITLHAGATARLGHRLGPLTVATPARACLDALRWEPVRPALEAVVGGVGAGRIVPASLTEALAVDPANVAGFARLASLVRAITEAAAPESRQGRLAPVMRRAS